MAILVFLVILIKYVILVILVNKSIRMNLVIQLVLVIFRNLLILVNLVISGIFIDSCESDASGVSAAYGHSCDSVKALEVEVWGPGLLTIQK